MAENLPNRCKASSQGQLSPAKYSVLLRQLAELEAQINETVQADVEVDIS